MHDFIVHIYGFPCVKNQNIFSLSFSHMTAERKQPIGTR